MLYKVSSDILVQLYDKYNLLQMESPYCIISPLPISVYTSLYIWWFLAVHPGIYRDGYYSKREQLCMYGSHRGKGTQCILHGLRHGKRDQMHSSWFVSW